MKQILLAEAKNLPHNGLYLFMKEVGLRAITIELLNHGKARPIHGIPFVFHIG